MSITSMSDDIITAPNFRQIYGWIEVVTGVIKMAFLAIIIICLAYIIINCK